MYGLKEARTKSHMTGNVTVTTNRGKAEKPMATSVVHGQ